MAFIKIQPWWSYFGLMRQLLNDQSSQNKELSFCSNTRFLWFPFQSQVPIEYVQINKQTKYTTRTNATFLRSVTFIRINRITVSCGWVDQPPRVSDTRGWCDLGKIPQPPFSHKHWWEWVRRMISKLCSGTSSFYDGALGKVKMEGKRKKSSSDGGDFHSPFH